MVHSEECAEQEHIVIRNMSSSQITLKIQLYFVRTLLLDPPQMKIILCFIDHSNDHE